MTTQIYTGFWTDWSRGPLLGATVTLSARNGGLLLAFLAVCVTIVAIRFWRMLSFAAHQIFASDGVHDGLYYQRQYILRNASAPSDAIWLFLQQAWHWRGVADRALFRTVPFALLAIVYLALFATASVLSSWISDGATEHRILKLQNCGFVVPADRDALHELRAHENYEAANYARQCYGIASTSNLCGRLPVSSLSWSNKSVSCPFQNSVCLDVPAFQMRTDLIDSHLHLGINERKHNRIGFRRETVCSPLVTQPEYAKYIRGAEADALGWPDNVLIKYLYGPRYLSGPGGQKIEYTHIHNNLSWHASIAYNVWPYSFSRNENIVWEPIDALNPGQSDITLLLIAPNSVIHQQPNSDPVFSAKVEYPFADGSLAYLPDRYVSPIACTDQFQVCNPNNGVCSPLGDSRALFDNVKGPEINFNAIQRAAVLRIAFVMASNSFYNVIFTRTQSFLRAQERVAGLTQLPLASNQWELEMGALFSDTLASMQHQVMGFPTGPSLRGNISIVAPWEEKGNDSFAEEDYADEVSSALESMCHKQRVKLREGTLNFSVLGLGFLLGLGSLITLLSYMTEPLASRLRKGTGRRAQAARIWARDDSLQVMRMLFETQGAGEWEGDVGAFPRTKTAQWFEFDPSSYEERPRLTKVDLNKIGGP